MSEVKIFYMFYREDYYNIDDFIKDCPDKKDMVVQIYHINGKEACHGLAFYICPVNENTALYASLPGQSQPPRSNNMSCGSCYKELHHTHFAKREVEEK